MLLILAVGLARDGLQGAGVRLLVQMAEAARMSAPLLTLESVSKRFGGLVAVDGVDAASSARRA